MNVEKELGAYIERSKYAQFNPKLGRRENWKEAVSRLSKMHLKKFKNLPESDKAEIRWAFDKMVDKKVVSAMRSLQFGGTAIEQKNERGYNCAVRFVDSPRAFSEIFFLLLNGAGVGIGLNQQFYSRLPELISCNDKTGTVVTYVIEDTIEGWADSVESLLLCFLKRTAFSGRQIVFDYSKIRPKGSALKTSGGKAPGPDGLRIAHEKIQTRLEYLISKLKINRLRTIDIYDILMFCSDAVLSGGIRRSATSVIFEKSDDLMLNAKTNFLVTAKKRFVKDPENNHWFGFVTIDGVTKGVELDDFDYENLTKNNQVPWYVVEPQRSNSNNSILLLREETSLEEFRTVVERTRQYGEPGFVFADDPFTLFNPCFEISFIPVKLGIPGTQFCNLTSINGNLVESESDFLESTKAAAIIGTLQATYTRFEYLTELAKELTEEEALLGCSITGFMDNPDILLDPIILERAAEVAVKTNKIWAEKLGIKPAERVTTVKPEGCLALGHLVTTKYGFISIEDFLKMHGGSDKTFVDCTIPDLRVTWTDTSNTEGAITKVFKNGESVVKFMRCSNGRTIYCTPKHRWRVLDDLKYPGTYRTQFVQAEDFRPGYVLDYTLNTYNPETSPFGIEPEAAKALGRVLSQNPDIHTLKSVPVEIRCSSRLSILSFIQSILKYSPKRDLYHIQLGQAGFAMQLQEILEGLGIISYRGNVHQKPILVLLPKFTDPEVWKLAAKTLLPASEIEDVSFELKDVVDSIQYPYLVETVQTLGKKIMTGDVEVDPFHRYLQGGLISHNTSSLVLQSASGIHPYHSKKYFRRVTANRTEPVYQFFKQYNPEVCYPKEGSSTDDLIIFPLEAPVNAKTKVDFSAIEHLELIKLVKQHWVDPGSEQSKKNLTHNVSCTVTVKESEWDSVTEYIFRHRKSFAAVSLLPDFGDKLFKNAPLESVTTEEDLALWNKLRENFKSVPYDEFLELDDTTLMQQEVACVGGACEIS